MEYQAALAQHRMIVERNSKMHYQPKPQYPNMPVPSQMADYSRPPQPPILYSQSGVMTPPMNSPHLMKPTIMVDTEHFHDGDLFPATPALSSSSSAAGSPGSIGTPTHVNPMFSGYEFQDMTFMPEFQDSLLLSTTTPPMTPGVFQFTSSTPQSESLASSPMPYSRSTASPELDSQLFCNPGDLHKSQSPAIANKEVKTEAALASLSWLEDPATFDASVELQTFDESVDSRRPRSFTGSSIVSLGHESFIGEESFPLTPASSLSTVSSEESSCDQHRAKRVKVESAAMPIVSKAAAGSASQSPTKEQASNEEANESNENNDSGSEDKETPHNPAPANRRGRKASLTEDPSKTFVCDICNRRFRRQEHLKRHYRSLHTQEKPFECTDCGKKFSRSDNLAQHARTHGSGAFPLEIRESHDMSALQHPMFQSYMPAHAVHHDQYAKTLFHMAAQIPGSGSESEGEHHDQKKRKRVD